MIYSSAPHKSNGLNPHHLKKKFFNKILSTKKKRIKSINLRIKIETALCLSISEINPQVQREKLMKRGSGAGGRSGDYRTCRSPPFFWASQPLHLWGEEWNLGFQLHEFLPIGIGWFLLLSLCAPVLSTCLAHGRDAINLMDEWMGQYMSWWMNEGRKWRRWAAA